MQSGRFNRALTHAQTKSEDGAIGSRRFTIEYDESMRIQRNKVYALRDRLMMEQENLAEKVKTIVKVVIEDYLQEYPDRTSSQVRRYILDNYTYSLKTMPDGFSAKKDKHVKKLIYTLFEKEMAKKTSIVQTQEGMLEFYRLAVLKAIDEAWIEEVDSLQQLKGVITTRSTAQKGSVSEYYKESLRSYKEMTRQIQQKIVRNIMLSTIEVDKEGRFSIYFV